MKCPLSVFFWWRPADTVRTRAEPQADALAEAEAAFEVGEPVHPYWANWSAEDKQKCRDYNCGHMRGDHSSRIPGAPCLQSRCLCDEFVAQPILRWTEESARAYHPSAKDKTQCPDCRDIRSTILGVLGISCGAPGCANNEHMLDRLAEALKHIEHLYPSKGI